MAHSLICGISESGKTHLARHLAGLYRHYGIKVLVLDPLRDPRWPCDILTTDPEKFLKIAKASKRLALFIDESGQTIGRHNQAMEWITTMSRHNGHNAHVICQRLTQVSPTVRDQCQHLFCFRVSQRDAEMLADEWSHKELIQASCLDRYWHFHAQRFGDCTKQKL